MEIHESKTLEQEDPENLFLLDVDLVSFCRKPALRLFFKNARGRALRLYDTGFEPYFYLKPSSSHAKNLEKTKKELLGLGHGEVKVKRVEETERSLAGKPARLLKIVCLHPKHVPRLREEARWFGELFEYDVSFTRRYLYDNGIYPSNWFEVERDEENPLVLKKIRVTRTQQPEPKLRALAFDIETYNPRGVPNPERDPAIMISFACSRDGVAETGVFSFEKKFSKPFVRSLSSEKEMLEAFAALLKEKKVDLLCSYNGDVFDLPYLSTRAKKTRAEFRLGRDRSPVRSKKLGLRTVSWVGGRVHFDVFNAASFLDAIGAIRVPRLTLEKVYAEVLGKEKPDVKKLDLWKAWDAGGRVLDSLAEYCRSDAVACLELALHFLPLEIALSRVTGIPLSDASRATTGQLVEALLMRNAFARREIVPNKPKHEEIRARAANPIKGAFVKMPEPGVYENLAVLDFRALYPSIIISHNVDPTTLNCDCCTLEKAFVSPQGHWFCAKRVGLIPSVLNEVIQERMKVKQRMKELNKESPEYKELDACQWALKIVANSVAPDEPLVLLSPENDVVVKGASEFIDPRLENVFVHSTQLGRAPGWKAACFNQVGQVVFKPIKKLMRHKASSLMKILLKSGREVKITRDHSVFTLNDRGAVMPIAGCDLKAGALVLVPKKMPSPDKKVKEINLLKALSNAPEEETKDLIITLKLNRPLDVSEVDAQLLNSLEEKQMVSQAAAMTGIGRRCAGSHLRYLKNQGLVSVVYRGRALFYQVTEKGKTEREFLKLVLPKLKYNGNKREHLVPYADVKNLPDEFKASSFWSNARIGPLNGSRASVILPLNEDVAALLGYFVSEGHARKWLNQTKGWSYRAAITSLDARILDFCSKVLNRVGLETQRLPKDLTCNTKMAFLLFKHVFDCGSNAFEKQVPSIILSAPREIKTAFLKAYFEGNGDYEKHAKRWRFTTVSKKLVTTLCLLLNQLGFCASIKKDPRFYRVVVNDALFGGERKLFRTFPFVIPGKLLEKEILQLGEKRFYYHLKGVMHKKALEFFKTRFEKKFGESEKLSNLCLLLDSNLAVDEVAEIIEEKPPECVYDISVEDDENFVGGTGLICLHNSFYGYLVYARSRWYSRECGESVTAWGRQFIQETISKAERAGFNVLYADTDSLFLLFKKGEEEKVREFQKKVNKELPEKMELELEGIYPRGLFVAKKQEIEKGAKKKYALINREGKIKIRGFELVRRDWSRIARRTQRQVLEILLKEGDVKKALAFVRDVIAKLKAGEVPLEDCVIYTQLQKRIGAYEVTSPELSAAVKARKAGIPIQEGAVIGFVITRAGKTISEKAQVAELARDYDADYYVNNQVLPAVLKILGALGVSEEDIKTMGSQAKLGGW